MLRRLRATSNRRIYVMAVEPSSVIKPQNLLILLFNFGVDDFPRTVLCSGKRIPHRSDVSRRDSILHYYLFISSPGKNITCTLYRVIRIIRKRTIRNSDHSVYPISEIHRYKNGD